MNRESDQVSVTLNVFNIADKEYRYAVIVCQYQHKWLVCKNKHYPTYEIPGGKREWPETIEACANRELREETGALTFQIWPVCNYSVTGNGVTDFGMLFFANIFSLGELQYEIQEIMLVDELPHLLTYPLIQPTLFQTVKDWLSYHQPKDCK